MILRPCPTLPIISLLHSYSAVVPSFPSNTLIWDIPPLLRVVLITLSCPFLSGICQFISYLLCLRQRTPLHTAAKGGHKDTVEYLVVQGPANINAKDVDGVSIQVIQLHYSGRL